MIKLYRDMEHPQSWIAFVPETGWMRFPAQEHGWEQRRPAHGLDPIHLREVPLYLAANTGLSLPEIGPPSPRWRQPELLMLRELV